MSRLAVALLGCVLLAAVVECTQSDFDVFCAKYGKTYKKHSHEYIKRATLFAKRSAEALQHNALADRTGATFTKGINEFSDWTESELSGLRGYRGALKTAGLPQEPVSSDVVLPDSVDWRKSNKVTPIKNQGQCGSCWAFAGTASIESNLAINTNTLMSLSEQEYVSCAPNPDECGGTGGCQGATPDILFQYAIKTGSVTETGYPYTSGNGNSGTCSMAGKKPFAWISNYTDVKSNDEMSLMTAVAKQPVTIAVDASEWSSYSGGILNKCTWVLDHAVLVVGYGSENGKNYWIVKNSWGTSWGEDGYIRLHRSGTGEQPPCGTNTDPSQGVACKNGPATQHVCGTCGMLFAPSYPTGARLA